MVYPPPHPTPWSSNCRSPSDSRVIAERDQWSEVLCPFSLREQTVCVSQSATLQYLVPVSRSRHSPLTVRTRRSQFRHVTGRFCKENVSPRIQVNDSVKESYYYIEDINCLIISADGRLSGSHRKIQDIKCLSLGANPLTTDDIVTL